MVLIIVSLDVTLSLYWYRLWFIIVYSTVITKPFLLIWLCEWSFRFRFQVFRFWRSCKIKEIFSNTKWIKRKFSNVKFNSPSYLKFQCWLFTLFLIIKRNTSIEVELLSFETKNNMAVRILGPQIGIIIQVSQRQLCDCLNRSATKNNIVIVCV